MRRTIQPRAVKTGPRINGDIDAMHVQVIDPDGDNLGEKSLEDALVLAREEGMDLVEIAASGAVPVCKILDYGKFKYVAQKKATVARKKQKTIYVKEVKMRPTIDTHDYDVKMRAMRRFLELGNKVKVTVPFRGREMAHQQLGVELLDRVRLDVDQLAQVEAFPKMDGRKMVMVLAPEKS